MEQRELGSVLLAHQRELTEICHMPQSSVARIESYKTIPKLDTLLKITQSLGLNLTLSPA